MPQAQKGTPLNDMPPTEQDIAKSILLQQAIRQGDQVNPSGGFSYLDNIANILMNPANNPLHSSELSQTLLDQLTGKGDPRAMAPNEEGRYYEDTPYLIPRQHLHMFYNQAPGATDIPADEGKYRTISPYELIPNDSGKPLHLSPLMERLLKGKM